MLTKQEKNIEIDQLVDKITNSQFFYMADASGLNAAKTSELRRICFKNDIEIKVIKNNLLKKAFEKIDNSDYIEFNSILKGHTSILISEVANKPAKTIKEFLKKNKKPILKAAKIDDAIFIGENHLDFLASIKSKEEMLGDVLTLLMSPTTNLISALESGKNNIGGLLKTLEERNK